LWECCRSDNGQFDPFGRPLFPGQPASARLSRLLLHLAGHGDNSRTFETLPKTFAGGEVIASAGFEA
jgi:hypothetical protein